MMHQKAKYMAYRLEKNPEAVQFRAFRKETERDSSSQKITASIDERPCAAVFADIVDKDFGLLVQTLDCGGGGLAERHWTMLAAI